MLYKLKHQSKKLLYKLKHLFKKLLYKLKHQFKKLLNKIVPIYFTVRPELVEGSKAI